MAQRGSLPGHSRPAAARVLVLVDISAVHEHQCFSNGVMVQEAAGSPGSLRKWLRSGGGWAAGYAWVRRFWTHRACKARGRLSIKH